MSRERKEAYKSPEVEVLEVSQESVICSMSSNINPFGDNTEQDLY